jgi:hypothetical protein
MHCVLSSPTSGITNPHTPHSGLENLPTPIANPEAPAMITNPLRKQATENNQIQKQWQLQQQGVSTPRSLVSGRRNIQRFDLSDMTRLVFAMGTLLELYMWIRGPFISASNLETVRYTTRRISK